MITPKPKSKKPYVDNKKFYVPNDIWIATTNAETEKTELQHIMSIGERGEQ